MTITKKGLVFCNIYLSLVLFIIECGMQEGFIMIKREAENVLE